LSGISLLNDKGRSGLDIHTSPTKWTDISGIINGDSTKSAGITIFDHPENPRYPSPGYVINSDNKEWARFVYTNPGFLYNSAYKVSAWQTLKLRYRIYLHNELGEIGNLNKLFKDYIHN